LERAFPGYLIVSSAALYPFNQDSIDPSIRAQTTPPAPSSSKVMQVFQAYPNISFDSDRGSLKSFLHHVASPLGSGTSPFSGRRQFSTVSNPHLRRASVSSTGGLVDFSRRRRQKNLSAYSSILGKPVPAEPSELRSSVELSDFLPLVFDPEHEDAAEKDLSAWEVYSYCDSFLVHTELSKGLDSLERDDCASTITLVLRTSLQESRASAASEQDGVGVLTANLNSTASHRLCFISSVFVFPSVLTHAYCLLRQQLRTVLHCYELLQACGSADHDAPHNDLCNVATLLNYATSALMGLLPAGGGCAGKVPFSLASSSALVSRLRFSALIDNRSPAKASAAPSSGSTRGGSSSESS
jgi:hypothetical protein